MKALTVRPGTADSLALREIPEPALSPGDLLCELVAIGVCGTDFEIAHGDYGKAPPGDDYLVIGHESLGRVLAVPPGSAFAAGDFVVGIVRRPDPVPCVNCAIGEWDMCRNGLYTERGIKGLHGFASERYRLDESYAVKLPASVGIHGVLLEPTTVVAKAWEQCDRISARTAIAPKRALITGAGPVGLLAAMLGRQRGLEIHVLDRAKTGKKPDLVRRIGAIYHDDLTSLATEGLVFDVTLECTGAPNLVFSLMNHIAPDGILCLAGLSSGVHELPLNVSAFNQGIVLGNEVIFGTVNANRRHYEAGAKALALADPAWLAELITRRVPLAEWRGAFEKTDADIKTVIVSAPA